MTGYRARTRVRSMERAYGRSNNQDRAIARDRVRIREKNSARARDMARAKTRSSDRARIGLGLCQLKGLVPGTRIGTEIELWIEQGPRPGTMTELGQDQCHDYGQGRCWGQDQS